MQGVFREPTASVYVVTPGYLGFEVLPGKNWVLQTGRDYEITIDIYDKEGHKIHPSDVRYTPLYAQLSCFAVSSISTSRVSSIICLTIFLWMFLPLFFSAKILWQIAVYFAFVEYTC